MGTARSGRQTIVVLGGGIGGVVTANRLRRRLPGRHRVVLVNREPDFSLAASYLWVMNGRRRPGQITRPLEGLRRRGIDVVIGTVESIDPARRTTTVDGIELEADHLVVALGAEQVPDRLPGLVDAGRTFATLAGAEVLRTELDAFRGGRVLVVTAAPLYRCPAAPYEAAFLIEALLRRRGIRSEIAVHAAEPAPMGVAGPATSAAVTTLLADRGIAYQPGHQITGAVPGEATFADGAVEPFELLVYMPPIAPPPVVTGSGLAGPGGWIEADRETLETGHPDVYAIGDNVQVPLSVGKPLPRAGVFAHGQGTVVADRITARINGIAPAARFDGHGGCFIEVGDGRAGFGSGDFFAEPAPSVRVRPPSRLRHLGKVVFEQQVMRRWM